MLMETKRAEDKNHKKSLLQLLSSKCMPLVSVRFGNLSTCEIRYIVT